MRRRAARTCRIHGGVDEASSGSDTEVGGNDGMPDGRTTAQRNCLPQKDSNSLVERLHVIAFLNTDVALWMGKSSICRDV